MYGSKKWGKVKDLTPRYCEQVYCWEGNNIRPLSELHVSDDVGWRFNKFEELVGRFSEVWVEDLAIVNKKARRLTDRKELN